MGAGEVCGLFAITAGLGSLSEVGEEVCVADDFVVANPLASRVDHVHKLGGNSIGRIRHFPNNILHQMILGWEKCKNSS